MRATRLVLLGATLAGGTAICTTPVGAADATAGREVYSTYCATCHGENLHNTSGGVTFNLRRLKPDEHERFVHSVTNGKNQMPPWRGVLDEGQIESVWAYIRATVDQ